MSSLKICLGGWGFVDPRGGRARIEMELDLSRICVWKVKVERKRGSQEKRRQRTKREAESLH
jgi:hypothetical protein